MSDLLIELKSESLRRRPLELKQGKKAISLLVDPAKNYIKHIQVGLPSLFIKITK